MLLLFERLGKLCQSSSRQLGEHQLTGMIFNMEQRIKRTTNPERFQVSLVLHAMWLTAMGMPQKKKNTYKRTDVIVLKKR